MYGAKPDSCRKLRSDADTPFTSTAQRMIDASISEAQSFSRCNVAVMRTGALAVADLLHRACSCKGEYHEQYPQQDFYLCLATHGRFSAALVPGTMRRFRFGTLLVTGQTANL